MKFSWMILYVRLCLIITVESLNGKTLSYILKADCVLCMAVSSVPRIFYDSMYAIVGN